MYEIAETLQERIGMVANYWQSLSEENLKSCHNATVWSKKQILGHLCDSAQNNIRRFVVGQYQNDAHIVYEQTFWVNAANYQHYNSQQLLRFWVLLNEHLCIVLLNLPEKNYITTTNWGRNTTELVTLVEVAQDYLRHLDHHLQQMGMSMHTEGYKAPID